MLVKVGDEVKAGTPLFFNKYSERVLFTSPVSGTVAAVNRGEKRKVLSVTVTPDATQSYEEFAKQMCIRDRTSGSERSRAPFISASLGERVSMASTTKSYAAASSSV